MSASEGDGGLPRSRRGAVGPLALLLVALAACAVKPSFDVAIAHEQLAQAFDRPEDEVTIYGDEQVGDGSRWIVDFKLDRHEGVLQAQFARDDKRWKLSSLRERVSSGREAEWEAVGVTIGRLRGEASDKAAETERTMVETAAFVERYSVDHGSTYPAVNIAGLKQLVLDSGYTTSWRHDKDAWGNALVYHAAPDGQSYILLSAGADGRWDGDLETYFANTDAGMEVYAGATSDPNRDIIYATGAFVQRYEAGG